MQCMLKYMQQNSYKAREVIIKQINKYRKKINYKSDEKTFLFSRNIIIDRSFKKLENKMLTIFSIKEKIGVFYQLQLLNFMKIHDIFYSYLMCKSPNNFLLKQIQKFSEFIIIKKDKEYKLNDIDNSR